MKDVIVVVADDAYLEHAKYLMVNCRRQGEWKGEFSIISPQSTDTDDLSRRGIDILKVPDNNWTFMTKFWAFTPHYYKWDRALCLDLDTMVQGPIQKIFDGLGPRLPKILCDLEDGPIRGGLAPIAEHEEAHLRAGQKYPHIDKRMFNMAFIFYEPRSMPFDTREQLLAVHEEFAELNPTLADQMIINLHMYDRMDIAGKDYVCFFGMDYPCNRIESKYRQWRGDEEPIILHYTRWHAPWVKKEELSGPAAEALRERGFPAEAGGYRNHRLNRVCHEFYKECVDAFITEFPLM